MKIIDLIVFFHIYTKYRERYFELDMKFFVVKDEKKNTNRTENGVAICLLFTQPTIDIN